jgi:hypothetical protein
MAVQTPAEAQSLDAEAQSSTGGREPSAGSALPGHFTHPVAVYIAAHGVLMALVWFLLAKQHYPFVSQLEAGDGNWYKAIAQFGYETRIAYVHGVPQQMRIEFFPLYPMLMRAVSDVTSIGLAGAGLLISLVASLVAAAGIFAVVSRYASRTTALVTVALWAAMPTAYIQSMVYTEALFTALAAWALYALLRSRWVTAGVLAAVAGLLRAAAVPLIAVVCLACLIAAIRNRHRLRAILGILIAPTGVAAYLLYIGLRVHNLHAWFIAVRAPGWNVYFDFGKYTINHFWWLVRWGDRNDPLAIDVYVVGLLVLVSVVAAVAVGLNRRVPPQVRGWTWLGLVLTLGSANMWFGMARFLMPSFPLLVPAAEVVARASRRNQILLAVTVLMLSAWWGSLFLQTPGMGL